MKNKRSIASSNHRLQTEQQRNTFAVQFALSSSRIEGIKPSPSLAKKLSTSLQVVRSSK